MTKSYLFVNKMDINLNVLGASMMNRVGREVDRRNIVTVDNLGLVNWRQELMQKLTKPGTLGDDVGNGAVLCFSTGAGDNRLPLGRPGDEGWSKIDAITRGRAARVRAAGPIGVRISRHVQR